MKSRRLPESARGHVTHRFTSLGHYLRTFDLSHRGVAGLMVIGTARRVGIVEATDVRAVVKEQVHSLGGTFIEVEMTEKEKAKVETAGGYATEMS